MLKITPFLWYQSHALEAAQLYTSLFPNSKIDLVTHYGEGAPQPKGTVMTVAFELDGMPVTALNGGPHFKLSEAFSFVVSCDTQAELDKYWDALAEGGQTQACGWLKDRFGLSWQICPAQLGTWLQNKDPAKTSRMMQALWGMIKLDIAALQRAYDGN